MLWRLQKTAAGQVVAVYTQIAAGRRPRCLARVEALEPSQSALKLYQSQSRSRSQSRGQNQTQHRSQRQPQRQNQRLTQTTLGWRWMTQTGMRRPLSMRSTRSRRSAGWAGTSGCATSPATPPAWSHARCD